MDKGYVWFALNNSKVDYIDLSKHLARSIKRYNKDNQVCIITNTAVSSKEFDKVIILEND